LSFPYSYIWREVDGGNYSLTALAIDDDGATGTSTPVNIVVTGSIENPVLGTNQEVNEEEIRIFPNPFQSELFLKTNEVFDQIQFNDLSGRDIEFSISMDEMGVRIRPSVSLTSGIYLLSINSAGVLRTYRVIKK
ncbi:MAG: T9SS type A sorting domain-containing protein, partial [Cyclobacteriaceae bacterium]